MSAEEALKYDAVIFHLIARSIQRLNFMTHCFYVTPNTTQSTTQNDTQSTTQNTTQSTTQNTK